MQRAVTCGQESDIVQERGVDLEAVQGVHAGVVESGDQDVLVALAAAATRCVSAVPNKIYPYYHVK